VAKLDLVVGLGNPGSRYEQTRHNAGFWFVDALVADAGKKFKPEARFQAGVCKLAVALPAGDKHECWLLKPSTFMNCSGQAVASLTIFYKIPVSNMLVVHDDLDLPAGTVRLKQGGGHGGHNGLRDIIAHEGDDFLRLRIGIGHPGKGNDVTHHVLSAPPKQEEKLIRDAMGDVLALFPTLVSGDIEKVMQALHSKA
jgi:PTH1 family peptidyl-tRNA hydrolase